MLLAKFKRGTVQIPDKIQTNLTIFVIFQRPSRKVSKWKLNLRYKRFLLHPL
jgi:hypothetical protein